MLRSPVRSVLRSPLYDPITGLWGGAPSGPSSIGPDIPAALSAFTTTVSATGKWAKTDAVYYFHGSNPYVNRKNPGTFDATPSGGVTLMPGVGAILDGVDGQIDTNLNPSTAGGNFTQNAAGFAYDCRQVGAVTAGTPMGALVSGQSGCTINGRTHGTNNNVSERVNQVTAKSSTGGLVPDHYGLCSTNRAASNATTHRHNKTNITGGTNQTSGALPNFTFRFGSATGTSFAAIRIGGGYIGGNYTTAERDEWCDAFTALNEAIAVPVIADTASPLFMASYSWWNWPKFYANATHTYGVAMLNTHEQIVYRIDNSTQRIDQAKTVFVGYDKDDHSAGSVRLVNGGTQIATAYTGHSEDDTLRFRLSTDLNVSTLGLEEVAARMAAGVEYPQIHEFGSNIWLTHSLGNPDTVWDIHLRGTPWVRKKRLLQATSSMGSGNQDLYMQPSEPSASIMQGVCVPHPTNVQNALGIFRWDKSTGDVTDGTSTLGNIESGTNDTPICVYATLPKIRTPAANRSQRLLGVSALGDAIFIVDFVTANGSDAKYLVLVLTGNWWEAAGWSEKDPGKNAGAPFWAPSNYFCGGDFANEPHDGIRIRYWRESAGQHLYEQIDSLDGGDNFTTTLLKTISTGKAMRPISPLNAHPDVSSFWQEASFYTDFRVYDLNTYWVL